MRKGVKDLFYEVFFNKMAKEKKVKKVELNAGDYPDYGDYLAAKRKLEEKK